MAIASGLATPTPDRMSKLAFTLGLFIDPIPMLDAVCAYSPALAAERDWIGDNAYADELLEALLTLFFGMRATPGEWGAAETIADDVTELLMAIHPAYVDAPASTRAGWWRPGSGANGWKRGWLPTRWGGCSAAPQTPAATT